MSQYQNKSEPDPLAGSGTFLSRVFGFASVYSRLPQTYSYYDPESELYDIDQRELQDKQTKPFKSQSPEGIEGNFEKNSDYSNADMGQSGDFLRPPDKNLLDSESESDFSSSESSSPPSPLLLSHTSAARTSHDISPNIDWDSEAHRSNSSRPSKQTPKRSTLFHVNIHNDHIDQTNQIDSHIATTHSLMFELPGPKGRLAFKDHLLTHRRPVANPANPFIPQYRSKSGTPAISPKERALYLWANIVNMDEFLIDVYYYYRGKGYLSIIFARVVDISILVFVLLFATFLRWGIDYEYLFNDWNSNSNVHITLADLIIPNYLTTKLPLSIKILLLGFFGYTSLRVLQLYFDCRYKLSQLSNFYNHLLEISDDLELMTISWSSIVERLMSLKDQNSLTSTNHNIPPQYLNDLNSKVRLNAHDIANRIMRKENYMIALINKDVLDISLPCPRFLNLIFSSKSVLTRTLEWNIKLCINNFIFNENGQINRAILKETSRNALAHELSARFKMAAIINLILCPFIVIYFVLLYFFRNFNEYKSNPSSILGLRQYTPWAEWKLREFNELSHLFIKRLHLSIGPANTYINQFPGGVFVVNFQRLLNFVSSAFLAVLVIFGLFFDDEEHNFWSFEITQNRSTLFYISIFGTIWAVTANSVNISTGKNTTENLNTHGASFFYDPEASLRYVSQFTHYLPSSWNGKLHTVEVKNKFCELFSLKILIIVNEVLSLIFTPFVLWFKISNNSSAIIDFFREYTIHVDGLGYVCYFAMFNFEEKDKNMMFERSKKRGVKKSKARQEQTSKTKASSKTNRSDSQISDNETSDSELHDYYQDDKMIKSYMYFLESYGNKSTRGTQQAYSPTQAPVASIHNSTKLFSARIGYYDDTLPDNTSNLYKQLERSRRPSAKRHKGVLGMINQFSKQESGY